jgi:predicted lipoprotein with Yx(FWY)xxD motif
LALSPAIVKIAFNKKLKKLMLVNARGFTLYAFKNDFRGVSNCYDDANYHCSKLWVPLTKGAPLAGKGVKRSLPGVVKRIDGAAQVMYNGHPLYTDAGGRGFGLIADKKPDDVNGEGFAGLWDAVSPAGKPV